MGTMSTQIPPKINQLISQWPKGTVFNQKYLTHLGYSRELVKKYKKGKWIDAVGSGAFKLYHDHLDWYGGLYALQNQLKLTIHAGGKTALELKGYAHYLRPKEHECYLFGSVGEKLPKWFLDYDWGVKVIYKATNLLPKTLTTALSEYRHKEFAITTSSPERAALEMFYYIPSKQGFDEALKIMEGLFGLRPDLVQELLEQCRSVKVKRLFLYMTEKLQLPWFSELKIKNVDLGSGKRVIVKDGVLNKKYKITVPEDQSF
jgi:Transcriptional regulator, AbiEi antitoxin, Type IV TA system/Transcriptional regulator, AbiEi antitoxin N-terminal domain